MADPGFKQSPRPFLHRQYFQAGYRTSKLCITQFRKFSEIHIINLLIFTSKLKSEETEYREMELFKKTIQHKRPGF